MVDALCISDLHLGAANSQTRQIMRFLDEVENLTNKLIIVGDLIDTIQINKFNKHHWNVLRKIRNVASNIEVVLAKGNHDGPLEFVSKLMKIDACWHYIFKSGSKFVYVEHGDRHDEFIVKRPYIANLADYGYRLLQRLDCSHEWARYAKKSSKTFLKVSDEVRDGMLKAMKSFGCDLAIAGHTHLPMIDEQYANCGCWTDKICHYVEVNNGTLKLNSFGE